MKVYNSKQLQTQVCQTLPRLNPYKCRATYGRDSMPNVDTGQGYTKYRGGKTLHPKRENPQKIVQPSAKT